MLPLALNKVRLRFEFEFESIWRIPRKSSSIDFWKRIVTSTCRCAWSYEQRTLKITNDINLFPSSCNKILIFITLSNEKIFSKVNIDNEKLYNFTLLLCCIVNNSKGDVRWTTSTCLRQIFTDLMNGYISFTFFADSSWLYPI